MNSDQIAFTSLIVASCALMVAMWAVYKSNRNSSVATLVTLYESVRQAFQRYLDESGEKKDYQFAELMNLLEICAAILNERSFAGVSKELLDDFLSELLDLILKDESSHQALETFLNTPTTFKHIRKFYKAKQNFPLSVVKPPQWFQR